MAVLKANFFAFFLLLLYSNSVYSSYETLQLLRTATVENIIPMREFLQQNSEQIEFDNDVYLVNLKGGTKAVFKPVPRDDLGDAHAEVAAYKASQLLGFPEVPPTIIRKIGNKIGSLQLYIQPSLEIKDLKQYKKFLNTLNPSQVANLKLFYFVFGQWDSGPHNIIIRKEGEQYRLVAIDNSGLRNRQYVQYGEPPFVRVCYSDRLDTKDWHLPFPFSQAKLIENPSFENLKIIFQDKIPEKVLKNLSKRPNPLYYVLYKNSLWIQFNKNEPDFEVSYTDFYPAETITKLKTLDKKLLSEIFSEAKGSEFLSKEHLQSILERRDQVLKAYERNRKL